MQGRDHHPQLQGTHGGPGGLEGSQVQTPQAQEASDSAGGLQGSQSGLRKACWSGRKQPVHCAPVFRMLANDLMEGQRPCDS